MLSKRIIVAMIAAAAAFGFAVAGAGVVAVAATGHAPSALVPSGVVWTVLSSVPR
jgi:hypothetical protein